MTKFSDLKLHAKVLKAIEEVGYTEPTPIQAGAIPPALEGRDVLGIAQTGTGKTAAFTMPMITLLNRGRARARMPRSLVLAPTRELAAQVAENFDLYAKHTKLTKALLIGGVSFKEQDAKIDRGVDVLIATPGRLLDHFERGKLILSDVKVMVVDEADRMLDMGFIPDIERIFQMTPFTRQTLFFSATMAPEIERITNTFLSNPERIEVARQSSASATITQLLFELPGTRRDAQAKQKRDFLRKLIDQEGEKVTNGIIFCNRKVDVDIVAKSLKKYGHDAEPIHGDLDQSHRTRTLEGFRDGKIRFLVASDVAARGLDIPNVSHVFNFDVPGHAEDYVHRIGRTGRAGRLGTAMMISTPKDDKLLAAIESLIETTIPRGDVGEQQAPVSKASEADVAADSKDERPKSRSRSRSRSSSKPKDEVKADAPDTVTQTKPEANAKPEPKAKSEPKAKPEPRVNPEPKASEAASNDQSRGDTQSRSRGGKGRGRNEDRGPKVVGLGDHLPTFIEKSFADRRTD
ncbi:superfamily II DNA/RNA helicase [Litoreibacter halocynthiae]|uniref:DEAD-box ATP-dependent RNA helicase RhpA n=1 Tax=Litoreibacter halocynthiae TaxID=1242689 RepID=A0A4R7LHJ9_9RHOB|nr:DEAD/DEAH box helicase [Litoreibacter halocynthiae]TDT74924.1 superfamily II DNA/RNA helicase [Litoreibacter halocynthiae]